MQQILKRLELIKTSIALEDEEVIALQTAKLSALDVDETVAGILRMVSDCDYGRVVREIDAYLSKYSGMMVYEDQELLGLRLELKSLESRVQALSEEREECLFTIHEFNTRYTAALGNLIQKILRAKADFLHGKIAEDDPDVQAKKAEYEQAEREFEEFREESDEIRDEVWRELNDEELAALKQAYRDASRLCHPDLVPNEMKDQAHAMMQQLNEAYKQRDLKRVKNILSALESGSGFDLASDTITDKAMLKAKIDALRAKIQSLNHEVDGLKNEETFEIIQGLDDWNEYFDNIKQQLREEYDALITIGVVSEEKPLETMHAEFICVDFEQGAAEWLEWRDSGIGGSDAPTIMGENPWKSASSLLAEKLGEVEPFSGNAATRRGTRLEPEARELYEQIKNTSVEPICLQSTKYLWMLASLDGMSSDRSAVVEIKCGEGVYKKTASTKKVPQYYMGQLQHILAVTGLPSIDFFCYLPSRDPICLSVPRDDLYISRLIAAEEKFWEQVLIGRG